MMRALSYRIVRLFPDKWQTRVAEAARQGGLEDGHAWLAKTLLIVFLGGLGGGILFYLGVGILNAWLATLLPGGEITSLWSAGIGIITGLALGLGLRVWHLYYLVEKRRRMVEDILPDFLLLVAGNVRAGMTSFSAFKSSARPEFGPLSQEIRTVTSRSLGVNSFASALSRITSNIKSKNLNETIRFFLQAVRSGGKMAQLLENTSAELRQSQELKKELQTSTKTYVIFVGFVMMIATPLLMAVAVEFIRLVSRIQGQASFATANAGAVGFLGGTVGITPDFLVSVAYILLFGNAILGSLFMGMIGSGKPLLGVRWAPGIFLISIIIFIIAQGALGGLLVG